MENQVARPKSLMWKLRRIAAGYRQQDIAARVGMSGTRYSAIERGEREPTEIDVQHLELVLPPLLGLEGME